MVPGMIMLWHGSVATIPSGWHLCDGDMGTPDLRNRFVFGTQEDDSGVAKSDYRGYLIQVSGTKSHSHTFTGDGHAHNLTSGSDIIDSSPAGDFSHQTNVNPATGTTIERYHDPPWYSLCYIMKL